MAATDQTLTAGAPDVWRTELGAHWRAVLGLLLCLLALGGALAPLADPDLPMHLAIGRWIVGHHTVPFVEPFAWTRPGAPYYAYSWLPQVAYYLLHAWMGPSALRVLHGTLIAGAAAAVLFLARAARWNPWTGVILVLFNVMIASVVAAHLRPQMVIFIAVPLAWAFAYRLLRGEHMWRNGLSLLAVSAIAANSHLLFPLVGVPWVLLLTVPANAVRGVAVRGVAVRRGAVLVAATVAGWLASPYGLVWPAVFRLNFAPNALFAYPTPIGELQPGLRTIPRHPVLGLAVLTILLLPWFLPQGALTPRQRFAAIVSWLLGLFAYGSAIRAILVWWMLMLPWVALCVERLAAVPKSPLIVRAQKAVLVLLVLLLVTARIGGMRRDRARYGRAVSGSVLPAIGSRVEPVVAWLACHTRPEAGGRIFTVFKLGTYLTWRSPTYSSSIDGRNIFPDSVAQAEAYMLPPKRPLVLGPWKSADLAIATLDYPVAAALDTATGWRRAATGDARAGDASAAVGLWVRDRWWARMGLAPLPAQPVRLPMALAGQGVGGCPGELSRAARTVPLAPPERVLEAFPR
ncbi:MAG: hypothetical protein WKG32_06945 [Gemmatimonadaceae bacterium]